MYMRLPTDSKPFVRFSTTLAASQPDSNRPSRATEQATHELGPQTTDPDPEVVEGGSPRQRSAESSVQSALVPRTVPARAPGNETTHGAMQHYRLDDHLFPTVRGERCRAAGDFERSTGAGAVWFFRTVGRVLSGGIRVEIDLGLGSIEHNAQGGEGQAGGPRVPVGCRHPVGHKSGLPEPSSVAPSGLCSTGGSAGILR
jgi:hypothetical protein